MRMVWVLVLVGCGIGGGPDPVRWLDWNGYKLSGQGMVEVPMPTVGPGTCPGNNRAFKAEAIRKPVPEENPCPAIRAKLVICCPLGGRRCHGREVDSSCDDRTEGLGEDRRGE